MAMTVRERALWALAERDPDAKLARVTSLLDDSPPIGVDEAIAAPEGIPGRPDKPVLVAPDQLKARGVATVAGRAVLLHALCHIEFNAINLALDLVWRFPGMPQAFYTDWVGVAQEEAEHFALLRARLAEHGHRYGDFPAHDGLWEMAERTAGDLLARIALVPRTLEARGLDASPPIRDKLLQAGDHASAGILERILNDEIGHVALGNRWFGWLAQQRGLDRLAIWRDLARRYRAPRLVPPLNLAARRLAGFEEAELAALLEDAR
jgi:uncharacterized ferritin-like protein (DUF455 family)